MKYAALLLSMLLLGCYSRAPHVAAHATTGASPGAPETATTAPASTTQTAPPDAAPPAPACAGPPPGGPCAGAPGVCPEWRCIDGRWSDYRMCIPRRPGPPR
jgi:hypothetical protein